MVMLLISQLLTACKIKFNLNVLFRPVKGYRNYTTIWGPNVQTPSGLTVFQILCQTYSVQALKFVNVLYRQCQLSTVNRPCLILVTRERWRLLIILMRWRGGFH